MILPQKKRLFYYPFRKVKRVMPAGMGMISLLQHVLFQILVVLDVQLFQHLGNIALDGVGRNIHVVADLLVRPPAGRQHSRSKLRSSQIVRHVVPRLRVMNSTPSGREPISDGDDALEILREILLEYRLQHTAVDPIGTPGQATVDNAMLNSFLGGYSTGDVLVSFLMAAVFFNTIKDKGYHGAQMRKVNLGAGLIAALCLCIVYGGLLFMGACVSSQYSTNIGNADLLLAIIRSSGGQVAIYGLCLSVVLACLTTAIGQVTAVADFFETATHGKLPYKILVMVVPVITAIVASFGLDTIVALTSPWFSFAYPIALVLMILGVFEKVIPNDGAFKGATYLTVVFAFADLPAQYGVHIAALDAILNKIPLYSAGFGWIVPAVVGFVAGLLLYARKGKSAQAV